MELRMTICHAPDKWSEPENAVCRFAMKELLTEFSEHW